MPQFDFTTFTSQIVWFCLCYIILYLAVYYIIAPRLYDIIEKRKEIINKDIKDTGHLNNQIDDLKTAIQKNNQEANNYYQNKIEATLQKINLNRQISIANIKKTIDENSKKSRINLQKLIDESQKNSDEAIKNIANNIKSKIVN